MYILKNPKVFVFVYVLCILYWFFFFFSNIGILGLFFMKKAMLAVLKKNQ